MQEEVFKMIEEATNKVELSKNLFIVWSCFILGNRKYLVGSDKNNKYYEVTFNNQKQEWYIDEYNKVKNTIIQ